jgi:putative tryptophan/tyrosine transport system permease protein
MEGLINMEPVLELFINIFEMGFIYSLVVLGVFLTSQIIKFDDLTVEGSFASGGAMTAFLLHSNFNPIFTLLMAIIFGMLAGFATGFLSTKFKINNLISGIVVTTGLFSINLKIAGANSTLGDFPTIFSKVQSLIGFEVGHIVVLICLSIGIIFILNWFLKTEVGLLYKAVGCNSQILNSLGKSVEFHKLSCLMLSNGIIALAGSLFVQHTGFFSITGSVGTLGIALAGLIIGSVFTNNMMVKILLGAFIYQAVIASTIELQIDPVWNRLITALIIVFLITLIKKQNFQELV